MLNKFTDIVNNQSAQADKDLAVSTAKENLARANKEARDEVALAKEIDNAETLVTDENSVIDPANAGENAQFFSMNDMSVQPVSSVEINGVSVDPNKHQKTLKSFKLRNVTNWHRKLYFIAPAISVCAIAGALTPIAIVKPIKAMEPVITIDDDSSEGISVKSNNVRLNKDSTITLNCDDQDRIKTVNAYINDAELNQDQYSFDSMSNVVSIKAEAMTSVNVKLKVITDAPRFNVTISDNPSGLKNIKHKSYASFRKEFTFECELRDNYILEQNEFSNGLELTVNGRRLTEANEVSVKQLNGNKYAITIQKGIVNGDIKLSGRVTKFNCNFNKAQDTNEHNYVDKVHENETISYQHFDDIQNIVTLKDKGIRPKADITVDDNGREIKLVEGNDYTIASNWNSSLNKYEYDLNWTENGKKKIVGPVSMKLSASTATIAWDDNQVKDQDYTKVAVGMPARDMSFGAKTSEEGEPKIKDIKIINDNLGYKLSQDNDKLKLIPIPGETQRTGTLTIQARLDELVDTVQVKVVEPSVEIKHTSHEILVGSTSEGYEADILPNYLKDEYPEVIEVAPYNWKSDDENIIKVTIDGDKIKVYGTKKGITNLTATTTLTNKETGTTYKCVGKYRIDCVKPKFAEASWETIVKATKTFYLEYYKDNASKEDKIKAMKNLCNTFDDTEYIEQINEEKITDPDRQVEAHLASFIDKHQKVKINNGVEHEIQIIGINHDTIADGEYKGKKALFTFDSINVVCGKDDKPLWTWWDNFDGYSLVGRLKDQHNDAGGDNHPSVGKNWWFCRDQYGTNKHLSVLYKALNSLDPNDINILRTDDERTKTWDKWSSLTYKNSVYSELIKYFGSECPEENCPIKLVTKQVGMLQGMNEPLDPFTPTPGQPIRPNFSPWWTNPVKGRPEGWTEDQNLGSGHRHYEYAIENYDAYCFPLTTAEANLDGSKIVHGDVPVTVKNEGYPYFLYELDNNKVLKKDKKENYVYFSTSSPVFYYQIFYPQYEQYQKFYTERERFGGCIAISGGKPVVRGDHMVLNRADSHLSFAFCI